MTGPTARRADIITVRRQSNREAGKRKGLRQARIDTALPTADHRLLPPLAAPAQSTQIWMASASTGIEPTSAPNGGSRVERTGCLATERDDALDASDL
jgi:hypothetical protein